MHHFWPIQTDSKQTDAKRLVAAGHQFVLKQQIQGSATVVVVSIDKSARMASISCLGDSAALVIRKAEFIAFHTPIQSEGWNQPHQLVDYQHTTRDCPLGKMASSAFQATVQLEKGDVIIAATDGLFDNVFQADIVQCVKECLNEDVSEGEIARRLVVSAWIHSMDTAYASPFARDSNGAWKVGGKQDDIAVAVHLVQ